MAKLNTVTDPVVFDSAGLDEQGQRRVADFVRERHIVCVEVRLQKWDGFSPSPLSAACRGVIAGFGEAGLAAAVRFLEDSH
jgi:3-dehydroquinate dehydratase